MVKHEKKENMIAGLVGAFLGSLLGVACIVLLGQLGYVASVSGVVMAVCSLKGYELLGGRLSKKGIVVTCILILLMTWIGNRADWALSAASALDISFFVAFRSIGFWLETGIIESAAYWGSLALLYLFTLLGAVPAVRSGMENQRQADMS